MHSCIMINAGTYAAAFGLFREINSDRGRTRHGKTYILPVNGTDREHLKILIAGWTASTTSTCSANVVL